jgi:hypothetical protein
MALNHYKLPEVRTPLSSLTCTSSSSVTVFLKYCFNCVNSANNAVLYARVKINTVTKGKESRNRPDVAQRFPGGLGSQISRHSAHEGGGVVSLKHRPPLAPRNVPGTHFY